MTQQTRLRLHKENRGRRVIKFLLLGLLCVLAGYQLDKKLEFVKAGKQFYAQLIDTFSPGTYIRGNIYDRNLKQLAVTMERVSVFARTREIGSIHDTAVLLSTVLELDAQKLQDQLESGVLRLWVAEDIRQDQEESLKKLDLPGVYLQKDSKRYYPNNYEASHLVGYVEDGFGLAGAEFSYDRILASRKLQDQKEQRSVNNGQDLVLTLDLKIQSILEAMVKEIAEKQDAYRVMAYLQESRNGEIIAGVHLPSFNPNNFTKYPKDVLKNHFLEPVYLPPLFRRLLRDASLLYTKQKKEEFSAVWDLVSTENDLGSQLQFWNSLGFDDDFLVDFSAGSDSEMQATPGNSLVPSPHEEYGTTPETLSPIHLLNGCAILLGHGKRFRPKVVKKIIDIETDLEIALDELSEGYQRGNDGPVNYLDDIKGLYDSQAHRETSAALYFNDGMVLNSDNAGYVSTHINDLTLVKIPSGSDDLFLLVLVQKYPVQVRAREVDDSTVASIIDDKVERISVLQQVALTVADVVEPEPFKAGNYQAEQQRLPEATASADKDNSPEQKISIMPDLVGLSLRKSLRLMDGIGIGIKIEGTGRVVSQTPQPGTSLKNVESCLIVLSSKEKEMFEEIPARKKKK